MNGAGAGAAGGSARLMTAGDAAGAAIAAATGAGVGFCGVASMPGTGGAAATSPSAPLELAQRDRTETSAAPLRSQRSRFGGIFGTFDPPKLSALLE